MRSIRAAILLASIALAIPAMLSGQAFRALSFLDPNDPNRYSTAFDVSADGTTVVGESNFQAFRWIAMSYATLQPLGFLPGGTTSVASAVSANGSVVVGSSAELAFRWTQVTAMVSLGTLGGTGSSARGVSADGSVVIGSSAPAGMFAPGRGFRWTEAGGMVELGTLPFPGKDAAAWGVSADGSVVVGRSGCCENTGAVMAVRWVVADGPIAEGLGDLPGTAPISPWSAASDISVDGQTIVGAGGAPSLGFRWSGGVMTALEPSAFPTPHNPASAMDASANGSVIVGAAPSSTGNSASAPVGPIPGARAFIWTAADGVRDLKVVLAALGLSSALQGWTLEMATGISDDGNIIVGFGTHDGVREGWIAALDGTPFPSTEPDSGSGTPVYTGRRFFVAGIREFKGFLWHPSKGPQPIDPDPPPFLTAELLPFALAPDAGAQRVEQLAFSLENVAGLDRGSWSQIQLLVDANANNTIDANETTTVGGFGYADPMGRIVFLQSFEVTARTHYVLRASITGLEPDARVTVALRGSGVVASGATVEGEAVSQLTVSTDVPGRRNVSLWVVIAILVVMVGVILLVARRGQRAATGGH